ncbi:MAG: hypothetical protein IT445_04505 [Phycisphaeraceae bacterium]|nr:hypothetical protein [Phycisphaeraceae bacterium]
MDPQQVSPDDRSLTVDADAVAAGGRTRRAALVSLIAAVIWALAIVFLGRRLSWLMPLIGLLIGYNIRHRSHAALGAALLLTTGALLLGRVLVIVIGPLHVSSAEIAVDPALLYDAVMLEVYPPSTEPFDPPPTVMERLQAVNQRIDQMSNSEKRSAVAHYLRQTNQVVRLASPRDFFRWMDVFWYAVSLLLAAFHNRPPRETYEPSLVETPL